MSRIAGTFFGQARDAPGKLALVCEEGCLTFAQLAAGVRRLAFAMVARGARRGDHVGVVLHNGLDFVLLTLAAADLGLVLVPVSPSLPDEALAGVFAAADLNHLVGTPEALRALRGTVPGMCLAGGPFAAAADVPGVAALAGGTADDPPPFAWGRDADRFIITMTSGSTSAPKPIVLTQATKFNRAMAAMDAYGVTAADVTLAATPLYHSLAERLLLIALLSGGTCVLMSGFSPRGWIAAVRRHHVSFAIAVSYQLRQIGGAVPAGQRLGSLRCVVSSSALLEIETKALLRAQFGCAVHECYGASEIGIASSLDMSQGGGLRSVGRPAAGVDIAILGADGRVVPCGAVGEIVCRTNMLFGGYYGRPELTQAAMWGDYFRTGDLGRLDAAGYLYFCGRMKETIITGGMNVYPADIEAALAGYPGLADTAAFAVPDERLGEVVGVAYVRQGGADVDLRQLRIHCGRTLADFQLPRRFVAVPRLPRNAMGKLARHVLADACAAERAAPSP